MKPASTPPPESIDLTKLDFIGTHDVELKILVRDAGTQHRKKGLDEKTVNRYAEVIVDAAKNGDMNPFPPIDVFVLEDGRHVITRGFHRDAAHIQAKQKTISANLYNGSIEQAIAHAAGDNAAHGLPRSDKDLEQALAMVLALPGAEKMPHTEIAEIIHASESYVRRHRPAAKDAAVKIVKRGGRQMSMNTTSIGRKGEGKKNEPKAKKSKASKKTASSAEPKEGKSASSSSASSTPPPPDEAVDPKVNRWIRRIENLLSAAHGPTYAAKVANALESDALGLTKREIEQWQSLSDAKVVAIEPLVTGTGANGVRMKPYKAYEFIEAGPSKKAMDDLHLLAIASKDGVYVFKGEGFTVTVEHKRK